MTINARGEDDVEPETILSKVAKASGANFNFHKQTQEYRDAPRGPVVRPADQKLKCGPLSIIYNLTSSHLLLLQGSVYRKVNAVEEIQQTNKDNFWVQAQVSYI